MEIIEIGARTQIAYVLGDRDPFGHVNWESLNQSRCERTLSDGKTAFESWCDRYDRHVHEAARTEDFVKHFLLAYPQSEIPIWAACEFLSFGTLVELYGLMKDEDQTAVARALGVSGGARMRSFLHVMSYVRNVCAHHGRLWNRVLTVKLAKFHKNEVGPDLAHLAGRPLSPKLYPVLAVMAYLVRTIAPDSRWPLRLRELFKKQFPTSAYLSDSVDMGCPADWRQLPLWCDMPRATSFRFSSAGLTHLSPDILSTRTPITRPSGRD